MDIRLFGLGVHRISHILARMAPDLDEVWVLTQGLSAFGGDVGFLRLMNTLDHPPPES
jgi:hypothetical protein